MIIYRAGGGRNDHCIIVNFSLDGSDVHSSWDSSCRG